MLVQGPETPIDDEAISSILFVLEDCHHPALAVELMQLVVRLAKGYPEVVFPFLHSGDKGDDTEFFSEGEQVKAKGDFRLLIPWLSHTNETLRVLAFKMLGKYLVTLLPTKKCGMLCHRSS